MPLSPMKIFIGLAAILTFAACSQTETPAGETETQASGTPNPIAQAIASPDRWADDSARDETRKPSDVLAFAQIGPGMSVFEIEAGGGYFTELFSLVVGENGSVVMQNPEGFLAYVGDEIAARLADDRLANVTQSIGNFDALEAEEASVDLATWIQGPHDLYFLPDDGSTLGDPAGSFAEIFRILKSGGTFVVVDHSAIDGAPPETGNELHRIAKDHVIGLAEAAGFVLDAEGDFLANQDDDRTTLVFNPSIRGKTDQFALRFRKP